MRTDRLYEILTECTIQLRKGEQVERSVVGNLDVTEVYMMPAIGEQRPDLELVDVHFLTIGVDKARAEANRDELVRILEDIPCLKEGPSYITLGGIIGDQGAAFQLFALGQVLDLWTVVTPETFGFEGEKAREMAGHGFIMAAPKPQEGHSNAG